MRVVAGLVVALLLSSPALAAGAFSGPIEMTLTNARAGAGTIKLSIGDAGVLSELTMPPMRGQPAMTLKTLMRKDKPDTVLLINDAAKSYGEVPVPANPPGADETWTVKKLGDDTIAGYKAVHVSATSSKGNAFELWTSKEIMDASDFMKAQGPGNKIPPQLVTALKGAGADGFFVKMVSKGPDGSMTTMQLNKVTKVAPPASTFDVPTGYTKASGVAGALPPDVQKKLDEKMKTLTPEQQEQLKRAMAGQH